VRGEPTRPSIKRKGRKGGKKNRRYCFSMTRRTSSVKGKGGGRRSSLVRGGGGAGEKKKPEFEALEKRQNPSKTADIPTLTKRKGRVRRA